MIRVHVICEGQTEEMFVNEVLDGSLGIKDMHLYPSLIGKPGHKGGNFQYNRLLVDVRERLTNDPTSYCTTFFDFYRLPDDFPGKKEANKLANIEDKSNAIITALTDTLQSKIKQKDLLRFIPYVQMYEFEGLLFSAPAKFAQGINRPDLSERFQKIRDSFNSPEEINNSPATAPSKRILKLFRSYDKPVFGSLAAIEIGIDLIRQECQLFNKWIKKLERLKEIDS